MQRNRGRLHRVTLAEPFRLPNLTQITGRELARLLRLLHDEGLLPAILHAAGLDRFYRATPKGNRRYLHDALASSALRLGNDVYLMKKPNLQARRQYGALPVLVDPDSRLQIMLVTSRETARWIIPKGWPVPQMPPRKVAAREAFEEAGLVGKIVGKAIGSYHYQKQLPSEVFIPCEVKVFLLMVRRQLEAWPEKDQRKTRCFAPQTAASFVQEPALAEIIRNVTYTNRPDC
jgi:8-oxo-dGTP pyrophosphatase MutT (NUDIX family)